MNLSKYLIYVPYRLVWTLKRWVRRQKSVMFYCAGHVDYIVFREIHRQLPEIKIVARNRKVKKSLASYGIDSVLYPQFPDVLIMARHVTRKFPESRIVNIGMRHGAYHFKEFVSAKRYNAFDVYLMSSERDVECSEKKGITSGVAVGYPKIDPAFNGQIDKKQLQVLEKSLNLNTDKKTIIFTATWDRSGMSAVEYWYQHLDQLTPDYNVLVTLHQWVTPQIQDTIKSTAGVYFIEDKDILPYLMVADIMIGDMSSIIAEFCALEKPLITWRIPRAGRQTDEIIQMLEDISFRVSSMDELKSAVQRCLLFPAERREAQQQWNKIIFDVLDGHAANRAVAVIQNVIEKGVDR